MNTIVSSAAATAGAQPIRIGDYLRQWRQRRRLSQLDLALDAEISARHLSFVETGRAAPSRDMVLRLAERLDVPLRERNVMLVAAGFAPAYPQRSLDDPALKSARAAVDQVLRAHEPNPALAIDRQWNLVSANRMMMPLLDGIAPALLSSPQNMLRLSLHPQGLAGRIVNLGEWRAHLLERLHRQCEASADPKLIELHSELKGYGSVDAAPVVPDAVAVPIRLKVGNDVLGFISTTMVFGTPVYVTLSEIAIETFFPADEITALRLRAIAAAL
jgi:transcriptional regulator with XRE-family HTH domain